MDRLLRSPLRGFRWLFTTLAVLVVVAFAMGTSSEAEPVSPLVLLVPAVVVVAFGYLGLVASDAFLSKLVAFSQRYAPWLLVALGVATVAGVLFA